MVEQHIDQVLEALSSPSSPGAILEVQAPGLHYHKARGLFARGSDQKLQPTDGFRIASISKLFTGTLCMQLAENGYLDLDASANSYFKFDGIPMATGHQSDEITIWQLLTHTSGLWDFAASEAWGRKVFSERISFFDPKDILRWAFEHGEPVGAPGELFTYSDTGYVMLGMILEEITGQTWGALCREHILEPLNMTSTWLEGYEEPRSSLSHTYIDNYDGLETHGSVDWAAGGHVSTSTDLITFIRAMDENKLFKHQATWDKWLSSVPATESIGAYGAGVIVKHFGGIATIGHSGFWGGFLFHAPSLDVTVSGTVNLVENRVSMLEDIFRLF